MKYLSKTFLLILLTTLLCACSGGGDKEDKPGKIDTMTKEIGQEAVQMIKTPIDKAQAVADKEAQRAKEMEAAKNE